MSGNQLGFSFRANLTIEEKPVVTVLKSGCDLVILEVRVRNTYYKSEIARPEKIHDCRGELFSMMHTAMAANSEEREFINTVLYSCEALMACADVLEEDLYNSLKQL